MLGAGAAFALVLGGCGSSMRLTPQQMDTIHRDCAKWSAGGGKVREHPNHVGRIAPPKAKGTPVVIYGAAWCAPCHLAEQYLARHHIPFVARDIEDDGAAKAAMEATITAAGLAPMSSLPVIDVRGTVMYGFNPCVVDAAWAES
jgi:glutaredoxin